MTHPSLDDVRKVLGELAGAASLCWIPKPTGVFDSTQASKFVEGAIAQLQASQDKRVECEHDWFVDPEPMVTSNALSKKWRCKKCLVSKMTYD